MLNEELDNTREIDVLFCSEIARCYFVQKDGRFLSCYF